jgi:hypothetical protein
MEEAVGLGLKNQLAGLSRAAVSGASNGEERRANGLKIVLLVISKYNYNMLDIKYVNA